VDWLGKSVHRICVSVWYDKHAMAKAATVTIAISAKEVGRIGEQVYEGLREKFEAILSSP
jgi:hypothetical protein